MLMTSGQFRGPDKIEWSEIVYHTRQTCLHAGFDRERVNFKKIKKFLLNQIFVKMSPAE